MKDYDLCHVNSLGLLVTMRCTLKCRLCGMHVPYYKKPYHPDYDVIIKQIDRLFEIITSVSQFCIAGGEPLIRGDLHKLLDYIRLYNNLITDEILIITNGTLTPSQSLIDSAKRYGDKVRFVVNDYGASLSTRCAGTYNLLKDAGIRCDLRVQYDGEYYGGWVDYRDISERYTKAEAEEKFKECANPAKVQTFILQENGIIYPCQRLKRLVDNCIAIESSEFVGIFDDSETIEEKRKKILNFYSKYYTSCLRCDGLRNNSVRYKPAEQLTKAEISNNNLGWK